MSVSGYTRVFHPRRAVFRVKQEELFVEYPAALKLPHVNFQVDVSPEQLGLGTFADGGAQSPPCSRHVLLPDFELKAGTYVYQMGTKIAQRVFLCLTWKSFSTFF